MQNSANSIVTQRQVGKHTKSFNTALKSALREDPDIIVIGEMRDLETIEMAITAAETGHLVIATMHTSDAASTLNRMLDVFPPSQQNQIRAMTSGSLRGIICQRLIPSTDDQVVLASELLVNTNAVANIIRDAKETGLQNAMTSGKKLGMLTMNDSLQALLDEGKITPEVAAANTVNAENQD
jgi:twitching motility protein PilT